MITNPSAEPLYREVNGAALIGLLINVGLGSAKLFGGIVGNSFALVSDAVNSLGDVVATVVVLYALRVAQRPADYEHPYGHTRAEAIAGSNVAMLVIISALMIAWEAMRRITSVHDIPPAWTLWIAASNVIIKEGLYRYKAAVGRRTGSSAIIANAWDHRSDALSALAVLTGLGTILVAGQSFLWADEAAALVVAGAIVWSGISLFRKSASELMDKQAESDFVDQIRNVALVVTGVRGVEKLWVRKSGL